MLRSFLFTITRESHLPAEISMTALRVFVGLAMAMGHGLGKLPPPEGLIGGVAAMGFPAPLYFAWMAALAEFAGGLLLAIGLFTRPAALFVAFTMGIAAFVAHGADPFQKKELALLYLFVGLIFVFRGASRLSVDRLFAR
ncbi:MAG: DoxX family protein [Bdellovibrionaceae bacterium]|nr:DoxX family protein [Pseudobdellovibrionaceae bacterium]